MHSLIYVLKPKYKGSGLHAQYLASTYPTIFNACDFDNDTIPIRNRVWLLHNPFFYKYSILKRMHDISFVRKNFVKAVPGKKMTNGYSYFKHNKTLFNGWFPTIFQSHFSVNQNPSIGYYVRDCRIQSNFAFTNFASKLKHIPIITMGQLENVPNELRSLPNWRHTTDNNDFWKSCSHYFYYRCSDIEDPFPHTLLEAIQSKHRIISPIDIRRTHRDGIDDLLSFIDYDVDFNEHKHGKPYCELNAEQWQNIVFFAEKNNFNGLPCDKKSMYDIFCKMKDIYG